MSVRIEDVEKIAQLAKLEFSPEEKETFTKQFNQILSFVDKLKELDTKDVPVTEHVLDQQNVLRRDSVEAWLTRDDALANAPKKSGGFFSVPKVIG